MREFHLIPYISINYLIAFIIAYLYNILLGAKPTWHGLKHPCHTEKRHYSTDLLGVFLFYEREMSPALLFLHIKATMTLNRHWSLIFMFPEYK